MHAGRVHHKEEDRDVIPGCTRHPQRLQHRRHTTINLQGHFHSYLSESRGGPGPTWLSEGGWAGGGGGKTEFEGVPPLECSPPARQRRAAGEADGSDESLLSEETLAEAAWPLAQPADGGRALAQVRADTR